MKIITRILDRLMPWRTMPAAHCLTCGKYDLKANMVRWNFLYWVHESCKTEQWNREAW